MYDRYSLTADFSELAEYFRIADASFSYNPRTHFTPTQQVPVISHHDGRKCLQEFRWGLMPFWAKDAINADSEYVLEKKAYRRMFAKHRCIIPCTGFYVWKTEGKVRRPLRIALRENKLFGIAGLFELWKDSRGNEEGMCTLMTTRANRLVYDYSSTMPAILREDEMEAWLDPDRNQDTDYLQTLLKPYHPDSMRAYPVHINMNGMSIELEEDKESLPARYALLK